MSTVIVDIYSHDQNPSLVQQAYDEVLRPAFSQDELPNVHEVIPNRKVGIIMTVLLSEAEEPLGVAVTYLATNGIALLGYIAIRKDQRSHGFGGLMMDHLQQLWENLNCDVVLAEIHDPAVYETTVDEDPQARLNFYRQSGAKVLDMPWVQPQLSQEGARVYDMLLLELRGQKTSLPSEQVATWALVYYQEAEGDQSHDPEYMALIRTIPQQKEIALFPL